MPRHLLNTTDLAPAEVHALVEDAGALKRLRGHPGARPLDGKSVGLIFSKPSTRTRVSFEVAARELGGFSYFFGAGELQLGKKESVADTARVLSRYLHCVVIRTYAHAEVEEFARHSAVPVVNALTNEFHPCQALADAFTIKERAGRLEGITVAFLGDGASNMANSLAILCKMLGMRLVVGAPERYAPDKRVLAMATGPGEVLWEPDPRRAVAEADFLYTDVWVSMGFEEESKERVAALRPYQVNIRLLAAAPPHCNVLHCLPANRGMEITDEVMDGRRSLVFDQAENRLHMHKAILRFLLT